MKQTEKKLYTYDGPVFLFDTLIMDHYKAETYATSPRKAIANLTFKAKGAMGYTANSSIKLSSEIKYLKESAS